MARRAIKRSVRQRLEDILGAIDDAAEILDGADFGAYQKSMIQQRAIERCVEIVSEASIYVPDGIQSAWPDVPWREIADMGNVLRHSYHRVDPLVMWRTTVRDLPRTAPSDC